MKQTQIIRESVTRAFLHEVAQERFGDMVKAVVDIERGIMAIGAELHVDEEQLLLQDGSSQQNLWGINIYQDMHTDDWIEFDSMINIRPKQNNRSRSVEDVLIQQKIIQIVHALVPDAI